MLRRCKIKKLIREAQELEALVDDQWFLSRDTRRLLRLRRKADALRQEAEELALRTRKEKA